MDQFIEQLNQWGKDSILQYGLVDTIVIIVLILLTAVIISKLLTRLMKRQNFRNLPIWLKLKKYVMIIITIYSILTLFIPAKTILSPFAGQRRNRRGGHRSRCSGNRRKPDQRLHDHHLPPIPHR